MGGRHRPAGEDAAGWWPLYPRLQPGRRWLAAHSGMDHLCRPRGWPLGARPKIASRWRFAFRRTPWPRRGRRAAGGVLLAETAPAKQSHTCPHRIERRCGPPALPLTGSTPGRRSRYRGPAPSGTCGPSAASCGTGLDWEAARPRPRRRLGQLLRVAFFVDAAQFRRLEGHTDFVWSVAISRRRLLSGSKDRTSRLWDLTADDKYGHLEGLGEWPVRCVSSPTAACPFGCRGRPPCAAVGRRNRS